MQRAVAFATLALLQHKGALSTKEREVSTQRSVLITGASGGVGSALTGALADDGWRVFAAVRSRQSADALAGLGQDVVVVELDVTDTDSIRAAAATVEEEVGDGGLTGLVNNAGVIVQARSSWCRSKRCVASSRST